jgi:hypothetical protein
MARLGLRVGVLGKPVELRDFPVRSFIPQQIKAADITFPADSSLDAQ